MVAYSDSTSPRFPAITVESSSPPSPSWEELPSPSGPARSPRPQRTIKKAYAPRRSVRIITHHRRQKVTVHFTNFQTANEARLVAEYMKRRRVPIGKERAGAYERTVVMDKAPTKRRDKLQETAKPCRTYDFE